MASRINVRTVKMGGGAKSSYEKQRKSVRNRQLTRSRLPSSEWEIAASPMSRTMIFNNYGEIKGMDTDLSQTPIVSTTNTNDNAFCLNLVQAGAASWNRVGRKTHLKSLRVVGNVLFNTQPTATGGALDNYVRVVVVWDKQISGGAIPTYDTVFGITSQAGVESCPDITCPLRYDNMDRFKVICDTVIEQPPLPVQSIAGTAAIAHYVPFDKYLKLKNLESVYSSNSSPMTTADISTGALLIYFRARINTAGQAIATSDCIARLRYTD